jgi:hypothetical protein
MIKAGALEQLQQIQEENTKLKEQLATVCKRIKDIAHTNLLDPISKSNPMLYTELQQFLDPLHRGIERNGFVTFLQERDFFATLKFNLPPSSQQVNELIGITN